MRIILSSIEAENDGILTASICCCLEGEPPDISSDLSYRFDVVLPHVYPIINWKFMENRTFRKRLKSALKVIFYRSYSSTLFCELVHKDLPHNNYILMRCKLSCKLTYPSVRFVLLSTSQEVLVSPVND